MGYTIEDSGNRHYRISADREVVSPKTGEDFYVDRVKSRIGKLAVVRGRIFHPVDTPDDPLKVHFDNGWSAPAAAYYGTASRMAATGIAVATFDTYHPLRRVDIGNPLHAAEAGGMAMTDIVNDVVGEGETARIGHSTGALVAWRVALKHDDIKYVVGQAPVGVQHKRMDLVYRNHMAGMLKDEFYVYIKSLAKDKFGLAVAKEFMALNATDPSRLLRQIWMLAKGPDLAPLWAQAKEKGIFNGLMFLSDDRFFHLDDQLDVMDRKTHLVHDIRVVEDARHLHPNMFPVRDAELRSTAVRSLQAISRAGDEPFAPASGE